MQYPCTVPENVPPFSQTYELRMGFAWEFLKPASPGQIRQNPVFSRLFPPFPISHPPRSCASIPFPVKMSNGLSAKSFLTSNGLNSRGHGLNLVMGALSILVHAVRLNTLEFSNHKGVSWSGYAFNPFKKH